jgi:hypothetical protein
MHKKVPIRERGGGSDLAGNPDYGTPALVTAEAGTGKTFLVGSCDSDRSTKPNPREKRPKSMEYEALHIRSALRLGQTFHGCVGHGKAGLPRCCSTLRVLHLIFVVLSMNVTFTLASTWLAP